jgi:4-carboxymuconolactone decarboxylase
MDSIAGTGAGESAIKAQSDFTKPAYEYLMGSCFAGIWDRNGLEKKYRSLTVISYVSSLTSRKKRGKGLRDRILAAKGNIPQLKSHVKIGLSNGLKEEEIRECLLHVMGYCGFPTGLDA